MMPAISAKCPGVWFPTDPMGLSEIEIEQLSPIVDISTKMPLSMKRKDCIPRKTTKLDYILYFRYFKRTSIDFITYIRGRLIVIVY